ncbi:MAG TPA: prepilin-type N-terminal cleavage/methylation domain-containing protein [Sedimentisphaerales bacterium]|nr:prepilin-type N-terminal cleavage/methylation domain-containing protein [Sedimentisphaerales bacterium]
MKNIFRKLRGGFTMVELMTAVSIAAVPTFAVAMLLVGTQRQWTRMFSSAITGVHQDATNTLIAFGHTGRRSNKSAYTIYNRTNDIFTEARPVGGGEEIVTGNAVQFVHWDTGVNSDLMDFDVKGTVYALFYLENNQLKVDHGPYPPGGVDGSGRRRTGSGIVTRVLADNVTSLSFSHTMINSTGMGSVRIRMVLTEPGTGRNVTVKTATLMRNTWPR